MQHNIMERHTNTNTYVFLYYDIPKFPKITFLQIRLNHTEWTGWINNLIDDSKEDVNKRRTCDSGPEENWTLLWSCHMPQQLKTSKTAGQMAGGESRMNQRTRLRIKPESQSTLMQISYFNLRNWDIFHECEGQKETALGWLGLKLTQLVYVFIQ